MAIRKRGEGVTPERVVRLVGEAVAEKSQSAVARESRVALLTIQRCLKGIGEPTTATLEKLSDYFKVSVPWLRGEYPDRTVEQERWEYYWSSLTSEEKAEVILEGMIRGGGASKELLKDTKEFIRKISGFVQNYGKLCELFLKIPENERDNVIECLTYIKDITRAGDKAGHKIYIVGPPKKSE